MIGGEGKLANLPVGAAARTGGPWGVGGRKRYGLVPAIDLLAIAFARGLELEAERGLFRLGRRRYSAASVNAAIAMGLARREGDRVVPARSPT